MTYNVKEFGAKGDGKTNDACAINRAIARASEAGGVVEFPPGKYLCGTVRLKSHIELKFSPGAVIVASSDIADYAPNDIDPFSRYDSGDETPYGHENMKWSLLHICNCEDIRITGGKLIADDMAYNGREELEPVLRDDNYIIAPGYFRQPGFWYPPKKRPCMLFVQGCKDVVVTDLHIVRAPAFAGWFLNCERVRVQGMTIRNSYYQCNADGLHFSSCRNVIVSNCDFVCGDDCVAIDSCYGGDAVNHIVTGCVFNTSIHAVRIYTGLDFTAKLGREHAGKVAGVLLSDILVEEAAGVLLVNAFDGDIEDVSMHHVVARQSFEGTALCVTAEEGRVRNIKIRGLSVRGNGIGYLCAEKNGSIDDVVIADSRFEIAPKLKCWGDRYDGVITHCYSLPYNLSILNAGRVTIRGTEITWKGPEYSDQLPAAQRELLVAAIGAKRLSELEPDAFPAIRHEGGELILEGNRIADFVRKCCSDEK